MNDEGTVFNTSFNFLFMKVLKLPMCATHVYEMGHFTIVWPAKYKITSTGLQQLTTVWVVGGGGGGGGCNLLVLTKAVMWTCDWNCDIRNTKSIN